MSHAARPKIELHMHLEGAMPPEFALELAGEKSIDLSDTIQGGRYIFDGFIAFLRCYERATSVLETPEDYYRLTRAVLAQSAAQGVVYTESFLAPDFCGGGDVAAWKDYLAAIEQAATEMEAEAGIIMRAIPTVVRHFGQEQSRKIGKCAQETAGGFVTGFGMGGDENVGAQSDYRYAFDMAREAKLGLTTHAGEWGGVESISQAVRDLEVTRIGHGVQASGDAALMRELAVRGTVLEVCPISNVVLGVYDDMKNHPIEKLRAAGVKVTVSTDDPPFFGSDMTKEYESLEEHFGWGDAEFSEVEETAIDAAFCDDDTKTALRAKLNLT